MKLYRCLLAMGLAFVILISGCSAASAGGGAVSRAEEQQSGQTHYEAPAFRDAVFHEETAVSGNGVDIDFSAAAQGYVAVRAQSEKRLKCKVVFGETEYVYDVPGDGTPVIYPLQSGGGHYRVRVLQNTTENKYIELFSAEADVVLDSEFEPFLRPNQMADYDADAASVAKAAELAERAQNAAGFVSTVYEYISGTIDYDYDKAQWVVDNDVRGYVPDPDETLAQGKGICFDYASLAAAMLRSQGVPAKLITGYVSDGQVYHAWNMIWLEESGWITVKIEAPKETWQRIDLTFAAAGDDTALVGDGKGYVDRFVY